MHCHRRHLVAAAFALIAAVLLAASQVDAHVAVARPRHQQSGSVTSAPQVRQLWKTHVGTDAQNAPYLDPATNRLYVNSRRNMSVLDANTGAVIKSVKTRSQYGHSDVVPVGGTMVCANEYNYTTCRSKATLALVWEFAASGGEYQTTPLYVPSKHAIFVAHNRIHKLNAKTGKLQATSAPLPGAEVFFQHPSFSKMHNLVFAGDANFISALDADSLNLAWKHATNARVQTSGVFSEDESIAYFSSDALLNSGGTLYALHTASGKLAWQLQFPAKQEGCANSPSLHNGVLYVGTYGVQNTHGCYALDATTGKQLWKVNTINIDAGYSHIYGDTVLFPVAYGIFALALNGSGVAWAWTLNATGVFNIPTPTSDGKLFVGDETGNVFALQLPPSGDTTNSKDML